MRRIGALLCLTSVISAPSLLLLGCHGSMGKDTGEDSAVETGDCPGSTGWSSVAAGWLLTCGVHDDGCAECWGLEGLVVGETGDAGSYTDYGEDSPPADSFVSLSLVGGSTNGFGNQACGVREDATLACWGRDDDGQAQAPDGSYLSVGVTAGASCALSVDGSIHCWGLVPAPIPSEAKYVALSVGFSSGMAIDRTGGIEVFDLWGYFDPYTRAGPFVAGADGAFICAIRSDQSLYCWSDGDKAKGLLGITVPDGQFYSVCVSSPQAFACAIGADGYPICFGQSEVTPTSILDAPETPLIQVSCGANHACGVTPDHNIVCWGDTSHGQGTAPP